MHLSLEGRGPYRRPHSLVLLQFLLPLRSDVGLG